jgi:hypothetical protein
MKKPPEPGQDVAPLCRHERLAVQENRLRAAAKVEAEKSQKEIAIARIGIPA